MKQPSVNGNGRHTKPAKARPASRRRYELPDTPSAANPTGPSKASRPPLDPSGVRLWLFLLVAHRAAVTFRRSLKGHACTRRTLHCKACKRHEETDCGPCTLLKTVKAIYENESLKVHAEELNGHLYGPSACLLTYHRRNTVRRLERYFDKLLARALAENNR